jgi:MFS family permease
MADGALREAQFIGSQRDAAKPRNGLEGDQTIKRRKCAHAATMKDIHADMNNLFRHSSVMVNQSDADPDRTKFSATDGLAISMPMGPALVLGLAGFLANFDVTSVVVALPLIAKELALGRAGYAWVMDAYSIAFTGTLLIAGALADRHGRRKALLRGNIIFVAASVWCGLAWNDLSLILARAAQGVGAAFLVTGGFSLLASTYPDQASRARAFSWLGVITGVGMALGPTLGGVVAASIGWRWIFLINIPICAGIAWWTPRLVAEHREDPPRPLDYVGMALFTAALAVLIEALLHGSGSPLRLALGLSGAAALMAGFVLQQQRRAVPIFETAIFLTRPMTGVAALLAAVSIGYWAVLILLPPLLLASFGLTSDQAGIAMLAATLPMLFVPLVGSRLVERLGWRMFFATALAVLGCGHVILVGALALQDAQPPVWLSIVGMAAIGVGAALAHPQLTAAVVTLVPPTQAGIAAAMTVVMRQGSFAIGIALLGAMLATPERIDGYIVPLAIAGLACLCGAAAAIFCLPGRPNDRNR